MTLVQADAAADGPNTVEAESMVVMPVAETLRLAGPEEALTAATLWFNADARNISVAVVQTNRGDGSTDTTVYGVRPSVLAENPV